MLEAKRRSWTPRPTHVVAPLVLLVSALVSETLLAVPPQPMVKGRVVGWEKLLPQIYADTAKGDSHRYTWREPSPTVKQEFRKLSADVSRDVCVVALGSVPSSQAHEPVSVKVTGGRITPSTIVLSPGSRVSFKSADPFPHVLYEVANPQWAPNALAPGSTREWAASVPGLHQIRDQTLPSVVMYILVDPAVVEFAFPDRDGSFAMTVPPGEYTLKAFFEGKQAGKEATMHATNFGLEMKEPLTVGGGESK
jgi:hypothetical protein